MSDDSLTRRQLLAIAGIAAAASSFAAEPAVPRPAIHKEAADALSRLKEGNRRFADGKTRHAHESADWRKHLVGTQKPFATILGCSDSRVPIELVFDQGFGDLFVVRVAGNVIAPDVIGSLEYAVAHLATPLIVVVGHQGCGAVTAAVAALQGPTNEAPGIKALVGYIEPGLPKPLLGDTPEQRIDAAVEANVRWSIDQLARLPEAKKAIDAKRISLQGAVYELTTGRVRFLSARS
ncbi:MAG: carbonic anhydrase [Planctomycetia bacterium]|nr:carbonic anhydrase [Planctomycetia bacterium]